MAKKFNLGINIGDTKKNPVVAKIESIFNINYEELEVTVEEKEELIKYENDINFHRQKTMEHMLKYSKAIYEANQIFAKKGNGTFGKWIEALGIDRDSANVAIRKYKFYLEAETNGIAEAKKILTLPNRTIKTLTGTNNNFETTEVEEILTAENPSSKLREMQEKKEADKILEEDEKLAFLMKEKVKKQHQIKKLKEEIEKLEEEILMLKN